MLENNRDEINFHKFLKSVRKSQGISMEKLAMGICTKSEMSRVEKGTRLPDKLVRDRLTARLGISGEEYEEYLLPREYEQWECRMEIIRCINKKELQKAEEKIRAYETTYGTNCVECQFAGAMRFMLMELKGASEEALFEQIDITLDYTVPDMDVALEGEHPLADQELNLIMEYIRLKKAEIPMRNGAEWKLKEYRKIVSYVENSRMDKIAQAKVYSKLACFVAELVLKEYATEEALRYALELCTSAIEVLRDTVRLYYFVELNEYRRKLIAQLRVYVDAEKRDSDENTSWDELDHTSDEWAKLFHELYTENDLPVYMENFTHIYTETECNDACEVIRIRRAMMGKPRIKVMGNACTEKTLMRIELRQVNPSMVTVRELLERVGICGEYKRTRLVTSNADTLYLSLKLFELMDNYKHEEASKCIKELYECADMDISYNEQELRRQQLMIKRRISHMSNEEQIEQLTDIIECTVSLDTLMSDGEKYFTRTELAAIHDFATHTNGIEQIKCREIMEKMCVKALKKEVDASELYILDMHMTKIASIYGDEGRYEDSNKLSNKLLKEGLRNRRMHALTECMYNNIWNYQKLQLCNDNGVVISKLKKAYLLSVIARKYGWKDFFQRKLSELNYDYGR